jgi:hypothetical protein
MLKVMPNIILYIPTLDQDCKIKDKVQFVLILLMQRI